GENENTSVSGNSWNHFALSFNKRALKIYINGIRIANIPNAKKPQWWSIYNYTWGGFNGKGNMHIKNIRIAKGAVPLYDRMMTDGKFITYGITFDVGKATIKPESMGEINRIVQLMNENPHLKFSVEGHTDSTGNPASNQTLSEQRSQAIVAKLVEMGIAQDRLTAVGKGQNNPIADNSTDEGRAKNRRVEFVKM
ncbi:MAG: OmpA family protein, partial [Bacteroidaceae bacterium]|nr:OmpA family protein [Bacteroidaceae bacterium]